MEPDERELRKLFLHLYNGFDDFILNGDDRPLCVTPYDGAYETAGYVITVQGSPPRGTIVYPEGIRPYAASYGLGAVYISTSGRARKLGEAQTETVRAYLKARFGNG